MDCEKEGFGNEPKIMRKIQLLNINLDRYHKIKGKLIEKGRIGIEGVNFFLP